MGQYAKIFKAYDIRGVVPDELDEEVAEAVGAAFVRLTGAACLVTAHDMRTFIALAGGRVRPGGERAGRGCRGRRARFHRPALHASGSLGVPGAMITASHNPSKYNGIKLCRAGARPVGADSGLTELREAAGQGVPAHQGRPGTVTPRDLLPDYARYLRSLVDLSGIRPLTVAVDAGNGMAGHPSPRSSKGSPSSSCRCISSSTARSPTMRRIRSSPPTCGTWSPGDHRVRRRPRPGLRR